MGHQNVQITLEHVLARQYYDGQITTSERMYKYKQIYEQGQDPFVVLYGTNDPEEILKSGRNLWGIKITNIR